MNQDGKDDFIVTGNGAPNRVYSYDKTSDTYVNIIDGVTNVQVSLEKSFDITKSVHTWHQQCFGQ